MDKLSSSSVSTFPASRLITFTLPSVFALFVTVFATFVPFLLVCLIFAPESELSLFDSDSSLSDPEGSSLHFSRIQFSDSGRLSAFVTVRTDRTILLASTDRKKSTVNFQNFRTLEILKISLRGFTIETMQME